MILFPLTVTDHSFVSPATLPKWLEGATTLNPVTVLIACAVLLVIVAPLVMGLYGNRGNR